MTGHAPPFRCHACGSTEITVSDAQQMKRVAGRNRLHVDVRCRACKHEWYSKHPEALKRGREADAKARAS